MIPKHLRVTDKQPFSNGRRPSIKMTKLKEIKTKITSLDNDLTRIISSYIAKHGKQPNELDLMRDQSAVPLITQRKKLVMQFKNLQEEVKYAENIYQTIKDDPIKNANRSFQGLKNTNPFDGKKGYKDVNPLPALTPLRRIGHETSKRGTLWDPRFNASAVRVDPQISRYYKKLTKGFGRFG